MKVPRDKRVVWLCLIVLVMLGFTALTRGFMYQYGKIRLGMTEVEVVDTLGKPYEQISIGDGRRLWHYRPWLLGNLVLRRALRVTELAQAPYRYAKVAVLLDESGTVEATTFVGEDTHIITRFGPLQGNSIHAYAQYLRDVECGSGQ